MAQERTRWQRFKAWICCANTENDDRAKIHPEPAGSTAANTPATLSATPGIISITPRQAEKLGALEGMPRLNLPSAVPPGYQAMQVVVLTTRKDRPHVAYIPGPEVENKLPTIGVIITPPPPAGPAGPGVSTPASRLAAKVINPVVGATTPNDIVEAPRAQIAGMSYSTRGPGSPVPILSSRRYISRTSADLTQL